MTSARIISTTQRGLNLLHPDFSLKLFEPVTTLSGAEALKAYVNNGRKRGTAPVSLPHSSQKMA